MARRLHVAHPHRTESLNSHSLGKRSHQYPSSTKTGNRIAKNATALTKLSSRISKINLHILHARRVLPNFRAIGIADFHSVRPDYVRIIKTLLHTHNWQY